MPFERGLTSTMPSPRRQIASSRRFTLCPSLCTCVSSAWLRMIFKWLSQEIRLPLSSVLFRIFMKMGYESESRSRSRGSSSVSINIFNYYTVFRMKALLVALLVCVSMQTGLRASINAVMTQMDRIPLKNDFSKEMASLIELKMMQSNYVDEVLREIKQIRDQLQADQAVDDQEFATKIGQLNVDIEILEHQVEKLGNQLKATNTFLGEVNQEISNLIGTQTSLEKQLDVLNSKEEDIRNGWRQFQEDSSKRETFNYRSIEAINEMLQKLTAAVFEEQDRNKVLSEIHMRSFVEKLYREMGPENPIAAFVSMSTRFDVQTVKRVIQLLEHIRDTRIKEIEDAKTQIVSAQQAYETTLKEVVEVRDRLGGDLQRTRVTLKRRNEEKVLNEKVKKQIEKDLPIAQSTLSNLRIQRETTQADYNSRRGKRENEIKIISQAYTIVAQQVKV